ncbi:hypothetical protein [Rhizobium halophilum]|nr:hypothetical protein [Rhizobium halophilum]
MNMRILVIALIIVVLALLMVVWRPFQQTVIEEEPGQAPPHAIDQ